MIDYANGLLFYTSGSVIYSPTSLVFIIYKNSLNSKQLYMSPKKFVPSQNHLAIPAHAEPRQSYVTN